MRCVVAALVSLVLTAAFIGWVNTAQAYDTGCVDAGTFRTDAGSFEACGANVWVPEAGNVELRGSLFGTPRVYGPFQRWLMRAQRTDTGATIHWTVTGGPDPTGSQSGVSTAVLKDVVVESILSY